MAGMTHLKANERAFVSEVKGKRVAWVSALRTVDSSVIWADLLEIPRVDLSEDDGDLYALVEEMRPSNFNVLRVVRWPRAFGVAYVEAP